MFLSSQRATIENVKQILNKGIRIGMVGRTCQKQINDAADRLLSIGEASRDVLQRLGEEIFKDRLVFCEVDVDLLNKHLKQLKTVEAAD